jgi:hypothetical protein
MRPPTAGQLSHLQAANVAAMWDTCVRVVYDGTATDTYGHPTPVWTSGAILACGLDNLVGMSSARREVMIGTQVVVIDARLRLPIDTTLDHRDRIRITHRHGVALSTPEVYEIMGEPARGPSGLVVDLRTVTDGSS